MAFAPAGLGAPAPLSGGELLVDTSQGITAVVGGMDYSLVVPPDASWVGARFAFQGVRLEVVGGTPRFVPLNAMVAILGL